MPWFFYKSGQFFQKRSFREHIKRDTKKYLVTFIIWSFIGYSFFLVLRGLEGSLTFHSATYSVARSAFLEGSIPINHPLWFLLSLFGVRLILNIILPEPTSGNKCWICAITILFTSVIAYMCYKYNARLLPLWVANTAAGLSFFTLGFWLKEIDKMWWLIIPCLIIYVVCCVKGFVVVDMLYNQLLCGNYLLWIPTSLCGIVVFNTACRGIAFLEKRYSMPSLFMFIGKHAMCIYVTHFIVVEIVFTFIRLTFA